MAVIGINYDEGNKKNLGYKSVDISYGNPSEVMVFETGNFLKDWYNMRKFMIQNLSDSEFHFCQSSSVNHFIMDGAPYDSAWLKIENGKPVLMYEYNEDLMEFFVPEGTKPTWEQLKEMCNNKNQ
jgi:hypothetical protein